MVELPLLKRFNLKGNKLHLLQFWQICIETYTRSHQVATKTACRATLTQMLSSVCHRLQDSLASHVVRKRNWSRAVKSVRELWGAYHLTEKSGWGVESIMVSDLPVYRRIATSVTVWIQKKARIWVAWVWNREGTEKLVNGKQHSVWFVPTGMKNLVLYFRLEFPKSDLTTFHPEFSKFCVKW